MISGDKDTFLSFIHQRRH